MLTANNLRQLSQIKKHDPALFADTEAALTRCPEASEPAIMAKAMRLLAERLRGREGQPEEEDQIFTSGPEYFIECPTCHQMIEEDAFCPECDIMAPFDLAIATVRYGYGCTDSAADPIVWLKWTGQPKQEFRPGRRPRLVDNTIQAQLEGLELVDAEIKPSEIVRRYRRAA